MDRGAWGATVHGGHKESDTTEVTKQHQPTFFHNKKYKKWDLSVCTSPQSWGAQTGPLLHGRHLWAEGLWGRSSFCFSISCLFGMGYILLSECEKFQIQKSMERKETFMYVLLLSFEKPINNKYYEGEKKPMSSTKQEDWNNKDTPVAERNPKPYSRWKTPCGRGPASSEEPASGWAVATWVMTEGTAWIPGH